MADTPAPQPNTIDPAFELAQKRARAQLAMEGEERRKQREAQEKFHKEKELLDARKQTEKLRAQGETARLEAEQLRKIQNLRAERHDLATEEKQTIEEVQGNQDVSLSPLRTLKFDMNHMMRSNKTSMVSIAIKEDEKKRMLETGVIQEKKKNYVLIGFSLFFLLLGGGVLAWWGYGMYRANEIATTPNTAETVDSIVFAESYKDFVVNEENAVTLTDKLKSDVTNNNIPIGKMQYDRFLDNSSGLLHVLTTSEWLTKINSSAPDALVRLLDNTFMYGIFSSAQNSGFVIMKSSYYEKSYAEMRNWESSLPRDLYPMLSGNPVTKELQNSKFTDVSIKNIDARILKNADGTTAMVYAFLPDKVTLIIAHGESTILEVLTRITTPKPQR